MRDKNVSALSGHASESLLRLSLRLRFYARPRLTGDPARIS